MKVSLSWLKELVDVDVPVATLKEMLDISGTKVDRIVRPGEGIEGVIVARVEAIDPHPNADNLTLVTVETGEDSQRVVCGAKNFSIGDKVALARVGSSLPGMQITERKIRGEVSAGMLCSASELGISKDHTGLIVLPEGAPLGEDVVRALDLADTIFELEITPNRPDCMSVAGVAREVAALIGKEVNLPPADFDAEGPAEAPVTVEIEDPGGCPRYLARYVSGVTVGPSPRWMTARLLTAGVRPVSTVVDVTNYVLMELGQPLHAFDAGRVEGGQIVVRRARSGETLETLDGVARNLHPDDLLIAGRREPLAIAGVMGGASSEVSERTTEVILESAYFDPVSISYTSRRHQLRSEASARFERGADPEAVPYAAARAARLLKEVAGGAVSPGVVDRYPAPVERPSITLRTARTNRVLGSVIAPARQAAHLRSIGIEVTEAEGMLHAAAPSFRPDLTREADLVEEVIRLHGFDKVEPTLPPGRAGALTKAQRFERNIRNVLAGAGLREAWTEAFIGPKELDDLGLVADHPARNLVQLANPMTEDRPALRTTLLPALLRATARNTAQRAEGCALFEVTRVYEPTGEDLPLEPILVAGVFGGRRQAQAWTGPERSWDFFGVKGVLEALFEALGVEPAVFEGVTGPPFHPTRAASVTVGGKVAGVIGELHPDVCDRFAVYEATLGFEIALAPVLDALPEAVKAVALPKLPSAFIDLAIVVPEDARSGDIETAVREAGAPDVVSARLFDLYRGEQVPSGKKSLAFALELRAEDRTLTDEEALGVRDRILATLGERFAAELRA